MFSKDKEYVPFHSQCECVGPVSRQSPRICKVVMFTLNVKLTFYFKRVLIVLNAMVSI